MVPRPTDQTPTAGTELVTSAIKDLVLESRFGALAAFVTDDDPHTPVMAERYEEIEISARGAGIPFLRWNARKVEKNVLNDLLVFSVPTLLWVRWNDSSSAFETIMRIVGIVNKRKIEAEMDKAMEAFSQ